MFCYWEIFTACMQNLRSKSLTNKNVILVLHTFCCQPSVVATFLHVNGTIKFSTNGKEVALLKLVSCKSCRLDVFAFDLF
jgi:hypothetical protein